MKYTNNPLIYKNDPNDHIVDIDPVKHGLIDEEIWDAIKRIHEEIEKQNESKELENV